MFKMDTKEFDKNNVKDLRLLAESLGFLSMFNSPTSKIDLLNKVFSDNEIKEINKYILKFGITNFKITEKIFQILEEKYGK